MLLFKFVERQYLESFFSRGSLRIGTMYDFKDTVAHTSARSDLNEGRHHLIRSVSSPVKISKDIHEPIISEFFRMEGDGCGYVQDLSFEVPRDSGDGFIFCTSRGYSHTIFKRWNKDSPNNDSCYTIINPRLFFNAINKVIKNSAFEMINCNIVYTSDPIPYDSDEAKLSPAITKEINQYSWQLENRTIWSPRIPPVIIRPFIIDVPEAVKYCRPLSYMENGMIINY